MIGGLVPSRSYSALGSKTNSFWSGLGRYRRGLEGAGEVQTRSGGGGGGTDGQPSPPSWPLSNKKREMIGELVPSRSYSALGSKTTSFWRGWGGTDEIWRGRYRRTAVPDSMDAV